MEKIKKIENISNPFNRAPVYYIEKTKSTMKLAEEYCSSSVPLLPQPHPLSGTVIMAGIQTAGRGRVPGRRWEASRGKNLLFTLILSGAEMERNPLPIVIGLGISNYLKKHHQVKSTIKWPNDILVEGRKIAGIIIESRNNFFSIGIGVNINQVEFPDLPIHSATSLSIEKNKKFDLFSELELILNEIKKTLVKDSWQKEITARFHNFGKEVSISTGIPGQEKTITGIIEGIGTAGQLLLKRGGAILEIFSGEIGGKEGY